MPTSCPARAILPSFVAVLVRMSWPSLALQVQKQADTEVGELLTRKGQGTRTTQMEWVFSTPLVSCTDTCKAKCPTAVCDKLARLEIDSKAKMQDLLDAEVSVNTCKEMAGGGWGPINIDNGNCYWHDSTFGTSDKDECDFEGAGMSILCACEVPLGTCSVSEDPHIEVFDGSQISLISSEIGTDVSNEADGAFGEKWLVSSASVNIQARFENVANTSQDAFVRAIAISGDILSGNSMVIGSLEDQITWNGQPILADQESKFYIKSDKLFVNATRGSSSLVQDLSQDNLGVNVRLRSGISLTVNRLHKHVNVAIQMAQQAGGQEGLCGNFNGLGADDTMEMAARRFDVNVRPEESLFVGVAFD